MGSGSPPVALTVAVTALLALAASSAWFASATGDAAREPPAIAAAASALALVASALVAGWRRAGAHGAFTALAASALAVTAAAFWCAEALAASPGPEVAWHAIVPDGGARVTVPLLHVVGFTMAFTSVTSAIATGFAESAAPRSRAAAVRTREAPKAPVRADTAGAPGGGAD